MSASIEIRDMRLDEAPAVSDLARRVFDIFVGHEFSEEGVAAYAEYVESAALQARQESDHFTLVALVDGELAGMIEFRHGEHLSMLFVAPEFQRRGIARRLYRAALERISGDSPELDAITVNASRYAVPVYERFGFHATGTEQTVNGMIFVPMAAEIAAPEDRPVRGDGACSKA
jgi:ribosomal protein S18 acetylase RimI-like enzyme